MKDVYLDFGGWLKLDPNTRMVCIGGNNFLDPVITIADWQKLPEEIRGEYMLEDFVVAVRDCKDLGFDELTVTEAEVEDDASS